MSEIRWTPNKRRTQYKAHYGIAYAEMVQQHDGNGWMVACQAPGVKNRWRGDIPTLAQAKDYGNGLLLDANREAELLDEALKRRMDEDAQHT